MRLKVTYTGGESVEVNAGPRAQVALERQYSVGMGKAFDEERMEYVFYLAWAALHFAGSEPKDFDDFLARITDVDVVSEAEPERPTKRAARRTASPA